MPEWPARGASGARHTKAGLHFPAKVRRRTQGRADIGDSADNAPMKWTLTGAAALLIAGCSPALNWRTVPLPEADLTITLPCKPDQATRTVELAGAPVELSMVGCDADGATFAVSHAALADPAQVGAALTHWRAAMLARLQRELLGQRGRQGGRDSTHQRRQKVGKSKRQKDDDGRPPWQHAAAAHRHGSARPAKNWSATSGRGLAV